MSPLVFNTTTLNDSRVLFIKVLLKLEKDTFSIGFRFFVVNKYAFSFLSVVSQLLGANNKHIA